MKQVNRKVVPSTLRYLRNKVNEPSSNLTFDLRTLVRGRHLADLRGSAQCIYTACQWCSDDLLYRPSPSPVWVTSE